MLKTSFEGVQFLTSHGNLDTLVLEENWANITHQHRTYHNTPSSCKPLKDCLCAVQLNLLHSYFLKFHHCLYCCCCCYHCFCCCCCYHCFCCCCPVQSKWQLLAQAYIVLLLVSSHSWLRGKFETPNVGRPHHWTPPNMAN